MGTVRKWFGYVYRYAVVLVLGIPAVWLLAFGPRVIDHPPEGRVILNYWEKWTGPEGQAIQVVVDDFNNTVGKDKGIYVRCLSTADIEPKTMVSTAGGVPPDIAGLYDTDIGRFGARGALMPLDELAREHGIDDSTFKKVFWDECHYKGTLYGIVNTGYCVGLYYNKPMFIAAGLDPNKPPTSIAQLDEYAKRLDKIGPHGIEVSGFLPQEPGWSLPQMADWFGGSWWDDKHMRFTFTDLKVVEAFTWVQSYPKRLGKDAVSNYRAGVGTFDSPQNAFLAQTIAMEQQGTYFANFIAKNAPQFNGDWMVAAFPSNDPNVKDVTHADCDVMTLPRECKHPKESFEFMAYMCRQDVVEKEANLQCKLSPLRKVSEGFLEHHRNAYIRVFDRLASSPNAHGTPAIPVSGEIDDEMASFLDNLRLLKITPEQGLALMQDRLQAKCDEFMKEQRLRAEQHAE